MKFQSIHAGKWVAAKDDKVIASDKTLGKLKKKIGIKESAEEIKFVLIPKGYIAG